MANITQYTNTSQLLVVSCHLLAPPSSVSQEKVDCITVNCEPVKGAIDDLIQRLFDLLLVSLKKSIQGTDSQHRGLHVSACITAVIAACFCFSAHEETLKVCL